MTPRSAGRDPRDVGAGAGLTPRRVFDAAWDFLVGDDWRLALAAVAAIGLTALACALGLAGWWLAPLVALAALFWTLRDPTP